MKGLLDEKVTAQSLVDVIADRIEAAIISGELEPGIRLSEQALAASLGVSRGPLREAIRRLEGRKLLIRTPNIGVRVAALTLQDLNQMLQIREVLEGLAARLAAANMTDDEIAALEELLGRHEKQKSVREAKGAFPEPLEFDFHIRILNGSRNERLAHTLDLNYLLRVCRHMSSAKAGRAMMALDEHRKIIEALERRDPDAAERAMREHLRHEHAHVEAELEAASKSALAAPALATPRRKGRRASERVGTLS
jgi:DNA-binding GntR family transcriptional regulator